MPWMICHRCGQRIANPVPKCGRCGAALDGPGSEGAGSRPRSAPRPTHPAAATVAVPTEASA